MALAVQLTSGSSPVWTQEEQGQLHSSRSAWTTPPRRSSKDLIAELSIAACLQPEGANLRWLQTWRLQRHGTHDQGETVAPDNAPDNSRYHKHGAPTTGGGCVTHHRTAHEPLERALLWPPRPQLNDELHLTFGSDAPRLKLRIHGHSLLCVSRCSGRNLPDCRHRLVHCNVNMAGNPDASSPSSLAPEVSTCGMCVRRLRLTQLCSSAAPRSTQRWWKPDMVGLCGCECV